MQQAGNIIPVLIAGGLPQRLTDIFFADFLTCTAGQDTPYVPCMRGGNPPNYHILLKGTLA